MSKYESKNSEVQRMKPPGHFDDQSSLEPIPSSGGSSPSPPKLSLRSLRAAADIQAISWALEQTGWNRKRAAELLSISYRGLLYKIHQHNITPPVNSPLNPVVEGQ